VLQLLALLLWLAELLMLPLAVLCQLQDAQDEALSDTVAQLLLEMEPLKEEDRVALLLTLVLSLCDMEAVKEGLMEADLESEPEPVSEAEALSLREAQLLALAL
jgi:hypothetical protein